MHQLLDTRLEAHLLSTLCKNNITFIHNYRKYFLNLKTYPRGWDSQHYTRDWKQTNVSPTQN